MELRHLRYCIAVADAGSFTRAAATLRVAQQALSKQVADLERELGVRIFERTARGITLTANGAIFIEDARALLDAATRAVRRVQSEPTGGRLRVAYSYLSLPWLEAIGDVVAEYHRERPATEVDLVHLPTGAQGAALHSGSVDVAFGYLPRPDAGEIASELFREDPITAVALPASHPLTQRSRLRLRDLAELPMVVMPRDANPVGYDACMAALAVRGLRPTLAEVHAVGSPGLALVARGCWQPVVESMRHEAADHPGIVVRRFVDPPIPFGLWVRWRRVEVATAVRRFVGCCRGAEVGVGVAVV